MADGRAKYFTFAPTRLKLTVIEKRENRKSLSSRPKIMCTMRHTLRSTENKVCSTKFESACHKGGASAEKG